MDDLEKARCLLSEIDMPEYYLFRDTNHEINLRVSGLPSERMLVVWYQVCKLMGKGYNVHGDYVCWDCFLARVPDYCTHGHSSVPRNMLQLI